METTINTTAPAFVMDMAAIAAKKEEQRREAFEFLGEANATLYFQYKEVIDVKMGTPEMQMKVQEFERTIITKKKETQRAPKEAAFKALAEELITIFGMKRADVVGLITGKAATPDAPQIIIGVFPVADLGLKPTADDQKAEGMGTNDAGQVVFTWTMGKRYGGRGYANVVLQAIKAKGYDFTAKYFTEAMKTYINEKAPFGKGKGTNKPLGFKNKADFAKVFGLEIDLTTGEVKKAAAPAKTPAKK